MDKKDIQDNVNAATDAVKEGAEKVSESIGNATKKTIDTLEPITEKVRENVLGFGEIIVTVSVLVGLFTAVLGGISEMGNVGFFSGLSSMLQNVVSVVMGALVIFLLFAIKKNTDK